MSRASVISFLNRMADEGFLTYREATGKGGHKRLYRPSPTAQDEEGFRRSMAERIIRKAREELASNPLGRGE
jgi:DNA-binding PadR family transcriptional regulator